ncbi:conserved hypothetical protein, partial [Trichinella spiralis]
MNINDEKTAHLAV